MTALKILAWVYALGAAGVFVAFAMPVALDWSDYDMKGVWKCLAFALCAAVAWPVVVLVLVYAAALGIWYSRKEKRRS